MFAEYNSTTFKWSGDEKESEAKNNKYVIRWAVCTENRIGKKIIS